MTNAFSKDYVGTVGAQVQKLAAKRDNAMGKKKGTVRHFLGLSVKSDQRVFDQRVQAVKGNDK